MKELSIIQSDMLTSRIAKSSEVKEVEIEESVYLASPAKQPEILFCKSTRRPLSHRR